MLLSICTLHICLLLFNSLKTVKRCQITNALKSNTERGIKNRTCHCYICRRENAFFPPLGLEKPMNILEPSLAGVITSVRYTIWSGSVAKWRLHMVVKYNGFVTFFSRLFLLSSDSPQVAILVRLARLLALKTSGDWYTCLFGGWSIQIHYEGVSGPKNRQIWTRQSWFLGKKVTFLTEN